MCARATKFWQQDKFAQNWARYEPDAYSRFLLTLLNPKDGELILDDGCGNGRFSVTVGKNGSNVVALDMSRPLLGKALSKIKEEMLGHRVDLVLADMQNLPFRRDVFDKILCVHNLWLVPSYQKAVGEMFKALKKNGEILVDHLNLLNPGAFRNRVAHLAMKVLRRSPPPVFYRIPRQILSPFSDSRIKVFSLVIKSKSRLYVAEGKNPLCLRLIIKCSKARP